MNYRVALVALFVSLSFSFPHAAAAKETSPSIATLDAQIDFDCLDGAKYDPASGTVVLFGHRRGQGHSLRIPYFDYLAEALAFKQSPRFSLDPNSQTDPKFEAIRHGIKDSVFDSFHHLFDQQGRLDEHAAWFLGQAGVDVKPGLDGRETLVRLFRASGKDDASEMWHAMDVLAASPTDQQATEALLSTLRISSAVGNIERAFEQGKISADEKRDEFNFVFLRALGRVLEVDPTRYTTAYNTARGLGASPDAALRQLQRVEIVEDTNSLVSKYFWHLLQAKTWVRVPSWIDEDKLAGGRPLVDLRFENVSPNSWLGRTAYEADVALKAIDAEGPTAESRLAQLAPRLEPLSKYVEARRPLRADAPTASIRVAIVPGQFRVADAPDGNSMTFDASPLAVEITDLSQDGKTDSPDPVLSEYAGIVSGRLDELEAHLPSLRKAHEAIKIVAVARWLQLHHHDVALSDTARLAWAAPHSVPFVFGAYVKVLPGDERLIAVGGTGGVSLTPDHNWAIETTPVEVPKQDQAVAAAPLGPADTLESKVRDLMASAPNLNTKAAYELQLAAVLIDRGQDRAAVAELDRATKLFPDNPQLMLFAAQAHFNTGDRNAAADLMRKYLETDPDNAPAQRMLARFESREPQTAQAPRNAPGSIEQFDWNNEPSRAYYAGDERAPELEDIHIGAQHFSPRLPPPPPIPDSIQLLPQVADLEQQRADLTTQLQKAPPKDAPRILAQVQAVDNAITKVATDYGLAATPPPAAPSHKPKKTKPKQPDDEVFQLDKGK